MELLKEINIREMMIKRRKIMIKHKKYILILFLAILFTLINLNNKSYAEEVKMRDFYSRTDMKFGAILKGGTAFLKGSNLNSSYNLALDFHGESYLTGTTKISISWLSLTKQFLPLDVQKTTFSQVSPNASGNVTKNLLQISLYSPIYYRPENTFELGWIGGIFNQFVSLQQNMSGDTNNNLGINLGAYFKYYDFYPFIPYIDGKVILGSLYDNGKTYQDKILSSSVKLGYFFNGGLSYYIGRHFVLNLEYGLINPDFFTLMPIKRQSVVAEGATSTEPLNDKYLNFDENMSTINFSFGYLF